MPEKQNVRTLTPESENEFVLERQLQEFQQVTAEQNVQNNELIQYQAEIQRDNEIARQKIQTLNDEMLVLSQKNEELEKIIAEQNGTLQFLNASLEREKPTVPIVPNNSLSPNRGFVLDIPALEEPRKVGETLVIIIPDEKIFQEGTFTLSNQGEQLLLNVAQKVYQNYPENRMGIEVHCAPIEISPPGITALSDRPVVPKTKNNLSDNTSSILYQQETAKNKHSELPLNFVSQTTQNHTQNQAAPNFPAQQNLKNQTTMPFSPALQHFSETENTQNSNRNPQNLDGNQNNINKNEQNSDKTDNKTDNIERELKITLEKAGIITSFLTKNSPLMINQLRAVGYGAGKPVFDNHYEQGRQGNRRLEWVIYPQKI